MEEAHGAPRLLRVVQAFVDEGPSWGVRELAGHLNLPRTTVHRVLQTLEGANWVTFDAGSHRYIVGAELYRMGILLSARVPLVELARPILEALTRDTGETSLLGRYLPAQMGMVFLYEVESPHPLRYALRLGQTQVLYAGATGRCILAYLDEGELAAVVRQGLDPITPDTPSDSQSLFAVLEETRRLGYAVSFGERIEGAVGIAAPVFDAHGIAGCMALTVPQNRVAGREQIDAWGSLVAVSAETLSRRLGASSHTGR